MQYSVRSSSIATVPYSMKNLMTYSQFSSDVLHEITTALQYKKKQGPRLEGRRLLQAFKDSFLPLSVFR